MPVEILRLHVKRKKVGEQCGERTGKILDGVVGEVRRCIERRLATRLDGVGFHECHSLGNLLRESVGELVLRMVTKDAPIYRAFIPYPMERMFTFSLIERSLVREAVTTEQLTLLPSSFAPAA